GLQISGVNVTQEDATLVYNTLLGHLNDIPEGEEIDFSDESLIEPTARQIIDGLGALYK
ncbi:unnamed protein product, partial [marine sediment metagenome]